MSRGAAAGWFGVLGLAASACTLDAQGMLEPCPAGTSRCGEACVSLQSDPDHCGACGARCGAPSACQHGTCLAPDASAPCSEGLTLCGASCVDLQTDAAHCGSCEHACEAEALCQLGACLQELQCGPQETQCGSACVDLQTHPAHCGACSQTCALGTMCAGGICKPGCSQGLLACAGKCVDPLTDPQYCGAWGDCVGAHAGEVCGEGHACVAGFCDPCLLGQVPCDGFCVDLQNDPLHCGSCQNACEPGHACEAGACALCAAQQLECSGVCVDPLVDPHHCGDCATSCEAGHACTAGVCDLCLTTQTDCAGTCATLATDADHCGACGHACQTAHPCEAGVCSPCPAGQTLCSFTCVHLATDLLNCGSCGHGCQPAAHGTATCSAGACGLLCEFGFRDDNNDPADGCEATDMLLWLRADALTGLAPGASLQQWPDASGHGRTAAQTVAGRQPKYVASAIQGLPAVSFDGTDDFLVTPQFALFATASSELTIAVVFRATDLGSQRFLMMQPQNNCSNNLELGYRTGQADRGNFGLHHGCSHATVTTTNIDTSWRAMIVLVKASGQPPANVSVLQGGTALSLELDNGGWVASGAYGTLQRKVVVGGRDDVNNDAYNSFHKGELAELMVLRGALSGAALASVTGWISTRYGL